MKKCDRKKFQLENVGSKKVWIKKKICVDKNFRSKKNIGPKNLGPKKVVQNKFWVKPFGHIILGSKNLGKKYIWSKNEFGLKIFWVNKIMSLKKFWSQNILV